jgi:hypothetical protein
MPPESPILSTSQCISLRDYTDMKVEALQKIIDSKFSAMDKAVDIANSANNARLDGMNEFRQALNDRDRLYLPRAEYTVAHEALDQRLGATERVVSNLQGRMWAVAAVLVMIEAVLRFIQK